ncbi:cold shock and DUF1294 domain-containing protein [Variovorax sp. dw_308]|uniref:DUF1294 domain-containing protein n=1 Tax=Variovorax sp. dw_308 TaxID=2721546 RepID=UPI002108BE4C|nr:cold shock and DUF1294 domain-containing protein [Variovorax sp. dw_308]
MKRQGTLVRWVKDRGFGFIHCPDISADVFVHLRDFTDKGITPQVGMMLRFEEIHMGGKGPRAVAVQAAGAARQPQGRSASEPSRRPSDRPNGRSRDVAPSTSSLPMALLIAIYVALLGYGVWIARISPITLAVLLVISLSTFFIYGLDKSAAEAGRWRTSETTLHMLSLLGGWPGRLVRPAPVSPQGSQAGLHGGLLDDGGGPCRHRGRMGRQAVASRPVGVLSLQA